MTDNIDLQEVEQTLVEVQDFENITVFVSDSNLSVSVVEDAISSEVIEAESIIVNIVEETIETGVILCSGGSGGGSAVGQIFIVDITNSGIISGKSYVADTVPANKVITEATTDSANCTIHFIAEGGPLYSPIVSLGGVVCTNLAEDSQDTRFFSGSFDVTVTETTEYTLITTSGATTEATIVMGDAGPEILTCVIGDYPGVQTAAKAGDNIQVTGTVEPEATSVRLLSYEGFDLSGWISCSGGTYAITGVVSSASGLQGARVLARNSVGTEGGTFDSSNDITLDQTVPQFNYINTTFPVTQSAFKGVETGSINVEVTDYSSLLYSSPHGDFSIANDTTYVQNKAIVCTNPGDYNDSSTNYRIVALKASNDTNSTYNRTIEVADIAPVVTMVQSYTRLRSTAAGDNYTITANADQNLASAPDIGIPVSGIWQGVGFSGGAKVWTRSIQINDSHTKGTGAWFFNTTPLNNAGLSASIAGDEVVGGFVARNITLPAFGTSVDLTTVVTDTSKLNLTWTVKAGMVFQTIATPPPVVAGWTIDSTGINPTEIIILDTSAAASSSQESTINIEETV